MTEKVNIKEAVAAYARMAGFAKAIDSAGVVLHALENAEQVARELRAKIETLRAEAAAAAEELVVAQKAVEEARAEAVCIRESAQVKATLAVADAEAKAAVVKSESDERVRQAEDKLVSLQQDADHVAALIEERGAELVEIEAKLAAAKAAVREALA